MNLESKKLRYLNYIKKSEDEIKSIKQKLKTQSLSSVLIRNQLISENINFNLTKKKF